MLSGAEKLWLAEQRSEMPLSMSLRDYQADFGV
jgi:hypothetical protein